MKKIIGYIMGLADKEHSLKQREQSPVPPFSKEELEFLLKLVSDCTFKGKEVQVVYDLVYKLQQLYIQ